MTWWRSRLRCAMRLVIRGIRALRVGRGHDTDAATEATDDVVAVAAHAVKADSPLTQKS